MSGAALLTIGDELLAGRTVDTNAAFLARRLAAAGHAVVRAETVGDDVDGIAGALRRLAAAADVVVTGGGLGPTPDDLTVEALARAAGVALVEDAALRARIEERTRGRAPERNARMARVPAGARVLANPVGTAPGLRLELEGAVVYALPGVPAELRAIYEASVAPDLPARPAAPRRTVRVVGLPEAVVADRLGDLLARGGGTEVGITVRHGVLTLTVVGPGADARADRIAAALGPGVFATDERSLAAAALDRLAERGWSLAVAESLTGGLLASAFVDVAGASRVFRGGVVAYTLSSKHALLGVAGSAAVSEDAARAMALGAKSRLGADVGLATTGVAGPGPDAAGQPAGRVHLALATPGRVEHRRVDLPGDRRQVRARAVTEALALLWTGCKQNNRQL